MADRELRQRMVRICHFDTGVDEGAAAVAFVDEEALDRNLFLVQSDSTTSSGAGMLQIGAEEKAMSVDLIAAPMNRAPAPANPVRLRRLRRYQSCGPDACCASKRGIKNIRSWPVAIRSGTNICHRSMRCDEGSRDVARPEEGVDIARKLRRESKAAIGPGSSAAEPGTLAVPIDLIFWRIGK